MSENGSTEAAGQLAGRSVGRYQVLTIVGSGGMGEVYSGHDPVLDRPVAIKRLYPEQARDDRARRLRQEAQMHGRLVHPNIVQLYDFVQQDDTDYIITEHIDGQSLRELTEKGPTPYQRGLEIMLGVARGLHAAHQNQIIHRDLKTENVLIGSDQSVKITDFGISTSLTPLKTEPLESSDSGMVVGTFHSMSPEQSFGSSVDGRSDLFSFGIVAYEVFAGRSPFAGKTVFETLNNIRKLEQPPLREFAPDVPIELSNLVDRVLAKKPEGRPSQVTYVVETLERLWADVARQDTRSNPVKRQQVAIAHLLAPSSGPSVEGLLAKFHEMVREAAKLHGGQLINAVGEEATVCLGFPVVHENNTRAAAELVSDLFARVSLSTDGSQLGVQAAIDVGEVSIHPTGASPLMIGSPVARAMKLGRAAQSGELLASAAAHLPLARFYRLEARQPSADDGLPLCYAVVEEQTIEHAKTTFVGRTQELSLLQRAWKSVVQDRQGQMVVLEGEAGIGKSRLVNRFIGDPSFEGRELITRATPNGRFMPFDPFRRLFGQRDRSEILGQIRTTDPEKHEILAAIAHISGTATAADNAVLHTMKERDGANAVAARIAKFLFGLAEEHPLLVVFEDLHWADHSSHLVLEEIAARAHTVPLCVIATHRPEYEPKWRNDHTTRVSLDRLSEKDATQIVQQCFGKTEHPANVTSEVLAKALGVPLWLEELASTVALRLQAGSAPTNLVPPTLRDSVENRLQTVGPETRETAELLAAIGREISPDLVFAIAGRDRKSRHVDIEALRQRGLIQQRGLLRKPKIVFRHALMRDAIYATIEEQDKLRLHRSIISALHDSFPDWKDERPELFARHHEAAGDYSKAIHFHMQAGQRAAQMWSHDVACRQYRHALHLCESLEEDERLGLEREIRLAYQRSLPIAEGLWNHELKDNSERLKVLGGEPSAEDLWMAFLVAFLPCAVDRIETVLTSLRERCEDPLMRYVYLTSRGMTCTHRGELSEARDALTQAKELRTEVIATIEETFQETTLIVAPNVYLAWLDMIAGDLDGALAQHTEFEAHYPTDSAMHLNSLAMSAVMTVMSGNLDEAQARTDRVIQDGAGVISPDHICISRYLDLFIKLKRGVPEALTPDVPAAMWDHFLAWQRGVCEASSIIYASLTTDLCVDLMSQTHASETFREAARTQAQVAMEWGLDRLKNPNVDTMHRYITMDFYRAISRLAACTGDREGAAAAFAEARARCDQLARHGGVPPRFLMGRIERSLMT